MNNIPDLSQPINFLLSFAVLFLIVSARFFLVAGFFHLVFYRWQKEKWQPFKINREAERDQFRREMSYSFLSSIIFAIIINFSIILWQLGHTRIYLDVSQYGWAWLPFSLLISFIIHEIYYYWMHRWMHIPPVFRLIHKVHHSSRIPTPWTAFSFHPLESLLLALIFPITIMVLPMHPLIILIQLVLMTISSVINHLDMDVFPARLSNSWIARWMIGSTHHSKHHTRVNRNFGLHFTILDRLHGTEAGESGDLPKFKEKPISKI